MEMGARPKKLKTTLKNQNDLVKLHPDFSEEGKEEMSAGHVPYGCFLPKSSYTSYQNS